MFRALWIDGLNIADPEVLAQLASDCGVPSVPEVPSFGATARGWTEQWRASKLDRIPCLISSAEAKLVGLSSVDRLDLFVKSGLFGSSSDDACDVRSD